MSTVYLQKLHKVFISEYQRGPKLLLHLYVPKTLISALAAK